MSTLRISALSKAYGHTPILRGLDLSVASGSLVAILGASGSGKTTLLRLLSGFERASAGTIEIGGCVMTGPGVHVPPERRRIGYVAQEGALFPHLTVGENVVFGLPRSERRDRSKAERLLESVGLPAHYAARAPHQLSGGEQQRVALARALAPSPALVLLDEPFSALDAALRLETRQAVAAALAAAGATALLVTHDQSEALSMGKEVAVLRDGVLAQVAPPEELYRRPVDAALARFVGEAVLLPGVVRAGWVHCALGRLPLARAAADGPVQVMLRPEQIRAESGARSGSVRARVLTVTYFGQDASLLVSLEPDATSARVRVAGHMAPSPGAETWLAVEGDVMTYASDRAPAPDEPPVSLASEKPATRHARVFPSAVSENLT